MKKNLDLKKKTNQNVLQKISRLTHIYISLVLDQCDRS